MSKRVYVKGSNIAIKFPIASTVLYITAMHYWGAPEWLYGVAVVLLLITFVGATVEKIMYKPVDVLQKLDELEKKLSIINTQKFKDLSSDSEATSEPKPKTKFQERLQELKSQNQNQNQ